jgi:hypothetical protein
LGILLKQKKLSDPIEEFGIIHVGDEMGSPPALSAWVLCSFEEGREDMERRG